MDTLSAAFHHAPLPLAVIRGDGSLVACNDAFARQAHGAPAEARFWPADDGEARATRDKFLAVLRAEGSAEATAAFPSPDGGSATQRIRGAATERPDEFVVSLVRADSESPVRVWSDVQRRAAEQLERAVGGSRDGFWDWDMVNDQVYFSPQWKQQIGYADHEFPNDFAAWSDHLHPDERESVLAKVQAAAAHPEAEFENEFRLRHKDGTYRWVLARAAFVLDAQGKPVCMSGSHIDITERKRLERDAERERAFVTRVIDSIPNLIFVKDAAGNFVLVNDAVASLFHSTKESLVRRHNADVHANKDDLALYESIEAVVLREGKTVVAEETFAPPGESPRTYITTKGPIESATGEPLVMATSVDVTELKRVEAELRTAKDAAEAAARAKSQFLATMSHEIRTPLNGVIGMTDLLLASPLTADQRDMAETARQSADALLSIVNDVLDYSRIEEGRMEVESLPLRVDNAIGEVIDLLADQAERQQLVLQSSIGPRLGRTVAGDPLRLRQVLLNLVSNAIKFTPSGEVTVRARTTDEDDTSVRVRFEVADTGIGIPADAIPRLFQAFVQADGSTTRRYGGSGLGLAICKRLVELMGGNIGAYSTEGRGSTFWFVLPMARTTDQIEVVSAPSIRVPAPAVLPATPSASPLPRRRVLVVEDNIVNQIVVKRMLERLGCKVDVVADGTEAILAAFQARYALVLMDVQMPGLDGHAATRAIRAREGDGRHMPIVALTANALAGDRAKCIESGMDDFLAKPVELAQLERTLARWSDDSVIADSSPSIEP